LLLRDRQKSPTDRKALVAITNFALRQAKRTCIVSRESLLQTMKYFFLLFSIGIARLASVRGQACTAAVVITSLDPNDNADEMLADVQQMFADFGDCRRRNLRSEDRQLGCPNYCADMSATCMMCCQGTVYCSFCSTCRGRREEEIDEIDDADTRELKSNVEKKISKELEKMEEKKIKRENYK